LDVIQY